MSCTYTPQITAEFGKIITDGEINLEFDAIERAFDCLKEQIGSIIASQENVFNHGIVDNSYTIDPAFGVIQYLELQGDVDLTLSPPVEGGARVITLVVANAGSLDTDNYGRFSFKNGTVWTSSKDAPGMDGKPWNMYANTIGDTSGTRYEGFYGAIVLCVHDGLGWTYMVFARHHLKIDELIADPLDVYSRR
jgi:hypothetical protein